MLQRCESEADHSARRVLKGVPVYIETVVMMVGSGACGFIGYADENVHYRRDGLIPGEGFTAVHLRALRKRGTANSKNVPLEGS